MSNQDRDFVRRKLGFDDGKKYMIMTFGGHKMPEREREGERERLRGGGGGDAARERERWVGVFVDDKTHSDVAVVRGISCFARTLVCVSFSLSLSLSLSPYFFLSQRPCFLFVRARLTRNTKFVCANVCVCLCVCVFIFVRLCVCVSVSVCV